MNTVASIPMTVAADDPIRRVLAWWPVRSARGQSEAAHAEGDSPCAERPGHLDAALPASSSSLVVVLASRWTRTTTRTMGAWVWRRADLVLLLLLVVAANLPLLSGASPAARWAFVPALVGAGEWWRVPGHLFAHISLYHLLLDAGAFLMLYHGLKELSLARRLAVALGGAIGSTALASLAPAFGQEGLCGLSGAAHGLMAVTGLLTVRTAVDTTMRRVGWITFGLVAAKAVIEAATGHVLFASWHLGNVGQPNALCHLGGVVGAAAAWCLVHVRGTRPCHR
jgi:hypothetical protein